MATTETFKVSKKGFPEFDVNMSLPENLDDPRWKEIVSDHPSDVHDLALRAFIVNAQGRARNVLDENLSQDDNQAAVQAAITGYVYGARGGGFARPTISKDKVAELGFTPAQLASLRAMGIGVETEAANGAGNPAPSEGKAAKAQPAAAAAGKGK